MLSFFQKIGFAGFAGQTKKHELFRIRANMDRSFLRSINTLILKIFSHKNYDFSSLRSNFFKYFSDTACPACKSTGNFKRHAVYWKYYYREIIHILRLRCTVCTTTHAIIPAFSLPGTTIGTKEVEDFLYLREGGISRKKAVSFFVENGFPPDYPRQLEKMLARSVRNAKALFPGDGDHSKQGLAFIRSVVGESENPIARFNLFCLENGVNCIFCSRASILRFKKNYPGNGISHKVVPP